MARPKGKQDLKPRKKRVEWTYKDTKYLKDNWDLMSTKDIALKLNRSEIVIRKHGKRLGLKTKYFLVDIIKRIDLNSNEIICGIYAIYNLNLNKIYIGSSVDIIQRIKNHISALKTSTHYNKKLQTDFNLSETNFYFGLMKECTEEELLEEESKIMNKYSKQCLYNTWNLNNLEDIKKFLDKANCNNYTIDSNGCWNYNNISKDGYGRLQVSIDGITKSLIAHRVMYYKYNNSYPSLIRHKCDNKKCVNPDHLIEGSVKENNLDKSKHFNKEFEEVWILNNGDRKKIKEHFGYDIQISHYESKLNLLKKYIDIIRIPKIQGERGKKKQDITGTKINNWICIESHVRNKDHLWECTNCKKWMLSQVSNISKTKCCTH